jgi:hypothetical protein
MYSRAAVSVVNKMATMQHNISFLAPKISWSGGIVKEAVYIWPLPTTLVDLKKPTAVNSVMQDILLHVWDEFSCHLDVICAAGGDTLNICKFYYEYNQIYFTSYLSLILCSIYRLTKLSLIFLNDPLDGVLIGNQVYLTLTNRNY